MSRDVATNIFMPEIKIRWFVEHPSSLISNLYSLLDASTQQADVTEIYCRTLIRPDIQ